MIIVSFAITTMKLITELPLFSGMSFIDLRMPWIHVDLVKEGKWIKENFPHGRASLFSVNCVRDFA